MKFKKLLAGVCSMAIAASMMAVSASAAITNNADGSFTFDVATGRKDAGLEDYFKAGDVATIKVVLDGDFSVTDGDCALWDATLNDGEGGYNGFGGGIIINHAAGWDSVEWGNPGAEKQLEVQWNEDETEFYIEVEMTAFANALTDDDLSCVDGTWGQICLQQWWGGDFAVKEVELLDAEDTSVVVHNAADGSVTTTEMREAAAAEALKALQDAYDALNVDEVVASTTAAAEALGNSTAAVDNVTAAIEKVNGLEDAIANAQAAVDALKDGEGTDTKAAFEEASATVETAKADLAAAQKELNDAIAAYDAATAEQLNKQDEEIKKLEEEKAALEAELEAAQKDAAANADKIKDLEAQIAAKDEEIAAKDAEIEELKKNPPAVSGTENNGSSTGTSTGTGTGAGTGAGTDFQGKNPATGATAGLALAGLALAGVAVVATKKRK